MNYFNLAVLVVMAAAVLYLLLLAGCVRGILRSYRRTPARVQRELGYSRPEDFDLAYEDLDVEVEPDLRLRGWLFRTPQPRRGLLVYHHGIWDAAAPRLPLAARMVAEGFDCLFYDSRGHGASGGRYCTYGHYESRDLRRMLDYVETRDIDTARVVVVGHSMGAATAVYGSRVDERIVALVLEACYRDLPTAVRDYARLFVPFLPEGLLRQALAIAAHRARFEPAHLSPLTDMPYVRIPVLFVQGTADRRIKPIYAQAHYDAKPPPKTLHFIEGAHHGRVWHEGGEPYMRYLAEWLCAQMPVVATEPG